MKHTFLLLTVIALMFVACQKDNLQTVIIKSGTMECDECVKTIKKAIYELQGVKRVDIDLEKKTIEVGFLPLQTNAETIEIAITRAGYDANDRKRDPEAYENLPECCKHVK